MRIVVLAPNVYSETAAAMAANLAASGYVPVGAVAISTLHLGTLLRKVAQWGWGNSARYAFSKLISRGGRRPSVSNPYLAPMLKGGKSMFRNLKEVATHYDFPIAFCGDMNSNAAQVQIAKWSPDLIVFAGGNILRSRALKIPRLGVLNVHLGLLPEIRGMSSPEWSLLESRPLGITIHYMNAGIDTGPILKKYELRQEHECKSLSDLRHRLIALGVEKTAEVIDRLELRQVWPHPQSDLDKDRQFFVMHDWLRTQAAESLARNRTRSGTTRGQTQHGQI